ncbi:hypothetical protein PVK06_046923 [Gossypium arboreum]|uniref:CCHC-type domain-containing protein n=1 Tax=Gossypium arboreum TaxID=29729 RepID=A0ABR0MBZ8_GOSAR|nr:hypothetical protein PVK06_046923 [Gossypium arboreum]
MNSLCDNTVPGNSTVEEMLPKKVRFRDKEEEMNSDMVIELSSNRPTSWKDMIVSRSLKDGLNGSEEKKAVDILEGGIQRSIVNGMPSITSLDRIHQILFQEIGELVGKVVKLNMNTDSRERGRFARMAVYVNLEKPLVSQILINGQKQQVEYESFSTICFQCGRYGHVDNICKFKSSDSTVEANRDSTVIEPEIQKTNVEGSEKIDAGESGSEQVTDREYLLAAKEPEMHRSNSPSNESNRGEVVVDVGSLDSGRHSTVWICLFLFIYKFLYFLLMDPTLKNFSWNCQGCASRKFIHTFREYNSEHSPDIICLVEPIVSGNKVNFIIEQLGFNSSHRVEAVGFSGMPNFGFLRLSISEVSFLEANVTNEEIKRALFDMVPLKAPGSDGYHALFFQKNPKDFSQFRPISLCSVLYKLVMKVIANRFKVIFPKLISQEQSGFIAGQNISDDIILAQEVIHSMRCKRKGKDWMAIKLDLEKAYDRILWNGMPIRKFKLVRGICQGCPISPYQFVLCMDWPGHIIRTEMEVGNWDPIRLSQNGPLISHLFFVDDLVIFGKAHLVQARLLDSILNQFCEISGHRISVRKSNIFFSKITPGDNLSWSVAEVVKNSSCWARQYETRMGNNKRNNLRSSSKNISNNSWVILSTDGAMAKDSGYAALGGVARDHEGNWIVGFSRFLGVCSPFEV